MAAPAKKLETYEDYLAEEAAASQPELDDLTAAEKLDAGSQHKINTPGAYDEPIPVEVFLELQRRFKGLKRGSPERNYGVVEGDFNGKKYRYDAYAGQEAAGYPRDRTVGGAANWSQRLLESFAGTHESNVRQRNETTANRLQSRRLNADELYRQAMLDSQGETRRATREDSRLRIHEGARTRALNRFLSAQPRTSTRTQAQEDRDKAAAELARAQAKSVAEGRGKNGLGGKEPKPDFTPDQAFTNMRQAEQDLREIESDLTQMDQSKHPGVPFIPDWLEKPFDAGAYNTEPYEVVLKDAQGNPYERFPSSELDQRRKAAIEARDFAKKQVARFREIVKNGKEPEQPGTGDDSFTDETIDEDMEPDTDQDDAAAPEAAGEGWDEASTVPAGEEAPTPRPTPAPTGNAPAPTTGGKPRRRKPDPAVLAKLSYFDQLYFQLADEHPGASDAELKQMAAEIIAKQAPSVGGPKVMPPPRKKKQLGLSDLITGER